MLTVIMQRPQHAFALAMLQHPFTVLPPASAAFQVITSSSQVQHRVVNRTNVLAAMTVDSPVCACAEITLMFWHPSCKEVCTPLT